MSITLSWIKETTFARSGGELVVDFAGGGSARRTWDFALTAKPTNIGDLEALVGAVGGLPAILSVLPGDIGDVTRTLRRYTFKLHESQTGIEYSVEASYEQGSLEANPLDEKDVVSFDGSKETEEYFIDESDPPKKVLNTAKEAFEKNPERTTGCFKLVVEGNRAWADIDLALYASYLRPNAVCDGSFTVRGKTVGEGEAKMVAISVSPTVASTGFLYAKVKWEMECAPDWQDHFLNQGFNELYGEPELGAAQLALREITKGTPPCKVDKPALLALDGTALDPDADPVILDFKPYPPMNFTVFAWTAAE